MRKTLLILFCLIFLQSIAYSEWVSGYIESDGSYTEGYWRTNANGYEGDNLSYKITLFPLMYNSDYKIQIEEQVLQNIKELEKKIEIAVMEYEKYPFDFRCSASDAFICSVEFNKGQKELRKKLSNLIIEYNKFREEYKALLYSKAILLKNGENLNLGWNDILNEANSDFTIINQNTVQIIDGDRTYLLQTENTCFGDETPGNKVKSIQLLQSTGDRYITPVLSLRSTYTLNNSKLCEVNNYVDYLTPVFFETIEEEEKTAGYYKFITVRDKYLKEEGKEKASATAKTFMDMFLLKKGTLGDKERTAEDIYLFMYDFLFTN